MNSFHILTQLAFFIKVHMFYFTFFQSNDSISTNPANSRKAQKTVSVANTGASRRRDKAAMSSSASCRAIKQGTFNSLAVCLNTVSIKQKRFLSVDQSVFQVFYC